MRGRAIQVHERIWQIQAPFGGGGLVMLYLLRGSELALVDTGIATSPVEDIRPALREFGLDLADVRYILNTHGHLDHAGGNAAVKREAPEVQIRMHESDRPFAESHDHHRTFMTEHLRHLDRSDLVPSLEAFVLEQIGEGDAGLDRALDDGDRVDLGAGVELSVIHTPGHTPGSVCLLWERERLLLTGDAVQARGSRSGSWPLYFHASDYRRSLQRLRDVPADTLCLGHGYYSALPFNLPLKRGEEARQMIDESIAVNEMIDQAVRARLAADPAAANLAVAQGVTADLMHRLPTLLDPELKLAVNLPGATLWAHIREARGTV